MEVDVAPHAARRRLPLILTDKGSHERGADLRAGGGQNKNEGISTDGITLPVLWLLLLLLLSLLLLCADLRAGGGHQYYCFAITVRIYGYGYGYMPTYCCSY